MPKYYLKKLSNNLTVLIINTPKLSSLDITLYIKAGSIYEKENNNGIFHLLEHLLFLNTKKLEQHALGLDVCAYTKKDLTYFEIVTHKNFIKAGLAALFSVVAFPDFSEGNLKIIKRIVTEEMQELHDNPDTVLNQRIDRFLYQKNSLALIIGGNKKSVASLTLRDLEKCYKNFYAPDNMILTLVGNVEPRQTIKQINDIFRFNNALGKNNGNKTTSQITYPKPPAKPIRLKNNNFQQTYLSFVFPVSGIDNPKYIHYILLAEILNKKISQALGNSGLFYDIQLYYHSYLNAGEFRVITACKKNNIKEIIKKFDAFIDTLKISNPFFIEMKKYIKYQFLLKENHIDELSSLSLYLLSNKPKLTTLKDEVNKIDSIKFDEINKIKGKYINKKNSYYFVMD